MAEKLTGGRKSATVHQMPTRAAKGAAKSKPIKPTVKLQSSAPKPKSPAERDAEIRAANLDRRRVLASQDRAIDTRIEVIREQLKTLLQDRKQVRVAILGTGIPLALYDEAKADSLTSRVDLEEKERLRAEAREVFGVPTGVERSLFDGLPDAAKEDAHWADMGRRAGLAGGEREPPEGCPPERHNTYRTEYDKAQLEVAAAYKRTEASTTGAAPSGGMTLDEAASAGRQPAEDPDASHVSKSAGGGAPDTVDPDVEAQEQAVVDGVQSEVDKEFEASAGELAGQSGRQTIVESRETDKALAGAKTVGGII